jgi:hypothetical protein
MLELKEINFQNKNTNKRELKEWKPMSHRPFAEESIRRELLRAVRS